MSGVGRSLDRRIVCFRIPQFHVALARRIEPSLRTRPVAIVPTLAPDVRVLEVSPEARSEGVEPEMLAVEAKRHCPALELRPVTMQDVRDAHTRLVQVIGRVVPCWEWTGPGSVFLDLTGTTRLYSHACDTAARLERDLVRTVDLAGAMGLASTKVVAHVAADLMQPSLLYEVRPGSEAAFLAPLPVTALPLPRWASRRIVSRLQDVNLPTLGEIAAVPLDQLALILESDARRVWEWARGIDPSPVTPSAAQPCIRAQYTFPVDEIDLDRIRGVLVYLLEPLCRRLRAERRAASRLALVARYRDAREARGATPIVPPSPWESVLLPQLWNLAKRHLARRVRIRALTLEMTVVPALAEQAELFPDERAPVKKGQRISLALDRIRARFGEEAIWWGSTHAILRASSCTL